MLGISLQGDSIPQFLSFRSLEVQLSIASSSLIFDALIPFIQSFLPLVAKAMRNHIPYRRAGATVPSIGIAWYHIRRNDTGWRPRWRCLSATKVTL